MTARRAAALLLASLAASCGGTDAPAEVRVFAASSLTDVMQTIAADFEQSTGAKVKLNLASSSVLAKQIVEGAPCDVFLSADNEWVDFVDAADLAEPNTREQLLTNRIQLVYGRRTQPTPGSIAVKEDRKGFPAPSDSDLYRQALADPALKRIAIGDPTHVPAGRYTKQALESLGVWATVEPRMIPCESVRAVLALLERGEVDAGFVYETDARSSTLRHMSLGFLASLGTDSGALVMRDPVALPKCEARVTVVGVKDGSSAGHRFQRYLRGARARRVFLDAGFGVLFKSE
ncbi:MAG TPA: molybdate ABC transporter substrate-binding protein [Planctomycetota bacterium]|nr:molybdate ABC transporter substrate-binding protein [Planctomycetota bacterium]